MIKVLTQAQNACMVIAGSEGLALHYYNEFESFAADFLEEAVRENVLPAGIVDRRSIADVEETDVEGFTQCHWFAGIGGWALAARLAGWPDDRELWTGSCPCQPFSVAGIRKGFSDERHLWPEYRRLIKARKPTVVAGEQVASASEWLRSVRSDLEACGYDVWSENIQAASAGARHARDRAWFLADSQRDEQSREESCVGASGRMGRVIEPFPWHEPWESALSRFRALGDGLPRSVGATDAARNAIVPQVAAKILAAYMEL